MEILKIQEERDYYRRLCNHYEGKLNKLKSNNYSNRKKRGKIINFYRWKVIRVNDKGIIEKVSKYCNTESLINDNTDIYLTRNIIYNISVNKHLKTKKYDNINIFRINERIN
jgi:hypothetical protein